MDDVGPLDMPSVHHEVESNYALRLLTLVESARTVRSLMDPETCCHDRPYERIYFIRDADEWSRELDFELLRRRGPACRLLREGGKILKGLPSLSRTEGLIALQRPAYIARANLLILSECQHPQYPHA